MPCGHITKSGPPQIHHFMRKFAKKNDGFEVKGRTSAFLLLISFVLLERIPSFPLFN